MKRKTFLLSLPLIGFVGKLLAKPDEQYPVFDEKRLNSQREHLRKYPVSTQEAYIKVWDNEKERFEELPMGTDGQVLTITGEKPLWEVETIDPYKWVPESNGGQVRLCDLADSDRVITKFHNEKIVTGRFVWTDETKTSVRFEEIKN